MIVSRNSVQAYMKEHLPLYVFVSVLFVMGVIFGALMVNALTLEQKQELSRYLGNFIQTVDQGTEFSAQQSFTTLFGMHLKWILLIWLLGLSIIGLPLILILDFIKGVLIGFTVGYMVGELSWKGLLFSLVSVAPQNLIIIPAILMASVTGISFSMYMIRNRILQRQGTIAQPFISYSMLTLSAGAIMVGVALFEVYVTPTLMKWVTPML